MNKLLGFLLIVALLLSSASSASSQRKSKNKRDAAEKEEISSVTVQKFKFALGEALRYKLAFDLNNAEVYFKECIRLLPDEPAPYYEIANIYHQLNELGLALEHARKAAELDPDNYWYQLLYAESLQKLNKDQEAIKVFEQLTEKFPQKQELFMKLGMMYFIEGEYEKGIEVLNKVEKKVGPLPEIIEPKKMAYLRLNKVDKAAAEVRKLVEANPDELSYYLDLANLYQSNEMLKEAHEVYEEALKKFPDDGHLHLSLADYYHTKGNDKRAFDELKHAFRDQELNVDTKVKILLNYYSLINHKPELKKEAFELNEILVEVHPNDAKAHTIYGDFLYNERQLEKAKYHFSRAIEIDEKPFPIWNQLIVIEAELDHYDSVLIVSRSALELFPNQPSLYYYSGVANVQLGNYDEAIRDFVTGRKLVVDNDGLKAQFYISLGEAYNEVKKYVESDEAFEAALKINPNNANALNNYSYYLSLRGENLEKAEQMSARSNELVRNQSSYLDTYAWIMYKLQKYEQAREWIEKALTNSGSGSGEVLEHAGDIYYQLGEHEKALELWEKAKKANGGGSSFWTKKSKINGCMNRMSCGRAVVLTIMAFIILAGCKTKGPLIVIPVEAKSKNALIEEMQASEYSFQTISAKASVDIFNNGKKNSIRASIRMRKDSAIWINFSYIGFAGARVLITKDSVKVINYRESKYLLRDLDYVNNLLKIDIDFETIQSLLVGNSASFDIDNDEKLRTAVDKNRYFISSMKKRRLKRGLPEKRLDKLERKQEKNPERQRYIRKQERKEEKYDDQVYSVWLDVKTRKILRTLIKDFINDKELVAEYSNFRDNNGQLFPYNIDFSVHASDTSEIRVEYSRVNRDKPLQFVFNIPDKYEQMVD